ncbi:alkaline phosphatase family protein, partial [bacterium]|nr:alkaline phosphatase family protein [bacterium]
ALLALGSHRLYRWQSGIPSNTPAVQGGLFYGTRSGVPGYRWYDRARDRVMVASRPADLRDAEAAAAALGRPLLAGGSCINSMFGGGAAKRLMTLSAVREGGEHKQPGERADFSLFWLNPYAYTTAVVATLWDFATALFWHVASRFNRRKRLIRRTLRTAAMRAVGNAFLRETGFYWLEQDVARGVPVIYSNFVGYDEVAHHAGPDAGEARSTLTAFDRKLQRLRRQIQRNTMIAYDLVLLSDHGQSESVPFSRLYGKGLDDLVRELAGRVIAVSPPIDTEAAYVGGLLEEMRQSEREHHTWLKARGQRTLERMRRRQESAPPAVVDTETSLIVCVSGGLAHIYRKGSRRPLHLEEVRSLYPGLVEGLASHPGIGFVLVRDPDGAPLMIGNDGIRNLATGEIRGASDPLTPYWDTELWSRELARLVDGEMSGDLIVNGALQDRQRVVVFEEQVGSHGGLGGPQNYPFVLLPAVYGTVRADLQSPESLHAHLLRRLPETAEAGDAGA